MARMVEGNLTAAHTGVQSGEASLASTNQRVGEVQAGLATASQRIADNDAAMAATTRRLDNLETLVTVAVNRIETSDRQIVEHGGQIKALDERLSRNENDLAQASATAREALERAVAAGKLAEGKLVYETQLSDESAPFAFQSATLTDSAKQTLAVFASQLKADNQNVFLEIQGHTDNSGPAEVNHRLALARAESVRNYLHKDCGLPLHRMSVVSYGESRPLADNKTREGRMKNRRVQLVVLK